MQSDLPIVLDGGGGRRLRAALALACATGRAFSTTRFGAGRPEPGLRPAHLQVLRAAAALCDAAVEGADPGGERLRFAPRRAVAPVERLEVEAGPATTSALLSTLWWPLALAGGPSTLHLRGATHAPGAPTFHELALVWAPAAARLGFSLDLSLRRAGFPGGGPGEVSAAVAPAHAMPPLDLRHRGTLREVEVFSFVGGAATFDQREAERQAVHAVRGLRGLGIAAEAEQVPLPVDGAGGSHLLLVAHFERARSGHGAVAGREGDGAGGAAAAVSGLQAHLSGGGAVEPRLAAWLLLPAALAAAGRVAPAPGVVPVSRWSVGEVTAGLLEVAALLPRFLPVEAAVLGRPGEPGEVRVAPLGASPDVLPLLPHPGPLPRGAGEGEDS